MNISSMRNPFDFANPITDPLLFAGRADVLHEIRYYLENSSTSTQPINIALIGGRASGKTSLLNIAEKEAKERRFLTARINLDEGDCSSEMIFFQKIFDSIIYSSCSEGLFAGLDGKTYLTYVDMVFGLEIPESKDFCPFSFPLQYATSLINSNINAPVSAPAFQRDLETFSKISERPIALFFDECNVLSNSRILLEKLRNIFMNTQGFMLFITGTEDLFPTIDEVFSPIVRQFKKISVSPFAAVRETEQCIELPLESIGLSIRDVVDFPPPLVIREIHQLASGRPYEIQLICHVLFRKVQEGLADKMRIDLSVLETIREELESQRTALTKSTITVIQSLDQRQRKALELLSACNDETTVHDLWEIEYALNGTKNWDPDALFETYVELQGLGIFRNNDEDRVICALDDYGKLYAKYYLREDAYFVSFMNASLSFIWSTLIVERLAKELDCSMFDIDVIRGLGTRFSISDLYKEIFDANCGDLIRKNRRTFEDLYWAFIENRQKEKIQFLQLDWSLTPTLGEFWYFFSPSDDGELDFARIDQFSDVEERANECELLAEFQISELDIPSVDHLGQIVMSTEDTRGKRGLARKHFGLMTDAYVSDQDVETATFHGNLCWLYDREADISLGNNLGYLRIASGTHNDAVDCLGHSIAMAKTPAETALPLYNLAIVDAMNGDLSSAVEKLDRVRDVLESSDRSYRRVSCVFAPRKKGTDLEFPEEWNPDLLEQTCSAISVLSSAD